VFDQQSIASEIFAVTAPVYVLVFVGMFLKRIRMVDDNFIRVASQIVYKVAMPVLFFLSMSRTDLQSEIDYKLLGYFALSGVGIIAITSMFARIWVAKKQQAVFVQGVFRGNHGIIALALMVNLYGDEGLGLASMMVAVSAFLNNGLSPIIFAMFPTEYQLRPSQLVKEVLLSPMIIGVILGVLSSLSGIHLPIGFDGAAQQIASLTLPLALICIGASLSLKTLRTAGWLTLHTALGKLVWGPLLFLPLGYYWLGFNALEAGTLFVFLAVPAAAASYILAEIAGADSKLAANIVVLTTFMSLFTISVGLYLLNTLGWI